MRRRAVRSIVPIAGLAMASMAFAPVATSAEDGTALEHVVVDDIDSDGVQDLLTAFADGEGAVLRMRSGQDGTLAWEHRLSTAHRLDLEAVIDGDGDGVRDVVATHQTESRERDCETESCVHDHETEVVEEIVLLSGATGAPTIGPVEFHTQRGRDDARYVGSTRVRRGQDQGLRAGAAVARLDLGPIVDALGDDLAPAVARDLPGGTTTPYLVVARGTHEWEIEDGPSGYVERYTLSGRLVVLGRDGFSTTVQAPEGVAPDTLHVAAGGDDQGDDLHVGTLDEAGRTQWTPWGEGVWAVASNLTTRWSTVPMWGGGVPVQLADVDGDDIADVGVLDRVLAHPRARVEVLSGATGEQLLRTDGTMPVVTDRIRSVSMQTLQDPVSLRIHEAVSGGASTAVDALTVETGTNPSVVDLDGERRDVDGDGVLDILYRAQLYWVEYLDLPTAQQRTATIAVSGATGELLSSIVATGGGGIHAELGGTGAIGLVAIDTDSTGTTLTALDADGTELWHRHGLPLPLDGTDVEDLEFVELATSGASLLGVTWHGGTLVLDGATGQDRWSD